MAILQRQNGSRQDQLSEIRAILAPLKIELSHWPIERTPQVGSLLAADSLNDSQKEELLKYLDARFEEQKKLYGYQSRDLVVLHPQLPKLDELLTMFDKIHTHDDDEVRYIVDGEGIFGILMPNGEQAMLTVEAGEYIRVPKNTKHWFILTPKKRIKAVRYFTSKEGWAAKYTGDQVNVRPL